jgi:hypothetical protein
MATSMLLLNLEDSLLLSMEKTMKKIFKEIAAMETVPTYEELKARYFPDERATEEEEKPKKKKAKAAPKEAKEPKEAKSDAEEKPKCQGVTVKGAPCKKFAMAGKCFCSIHNPDKEEKPKKEKPAKKIPGTQLEEEAEDEPVTPKAKKTKKVKTPSAPKKELPVHSHEVDEEEHDDCDMCQSHGNVASGSTPKYEVAADLRTRLKNILGGIDGSDDEVEEEKAEELIEEEGNLLGEMIDELAEEEPEDDETQVVGQFGVDENGDPIGGFSDNEEDDE